MARAFDTNSNSATMSMAATTLNASMDPVSFQLDMGYGSMGTIINYADGVCADAADPGAPPVTPGRRELRPAAGLRQHHACSAS